MKKIYLGIVLLLSACMAQAQVTIFTDDFESGLGSWTLTGQWGLTSGQAYNGSYSLADSPSGLYQNNQTTSAEISSSFDLSTSLDANIYFKTKYDIENGFDYCYVDVSNDNGSNWTTAYTINGEGFLSSWSDINVNMGGFVGSSQVKVRFRLYTDGGYQSDGIFIDSLRITKDSVDNAPPLILHDPDIHYEGQVDTNFEVVTITDISGVASAQLYYSVDGSTPVAITAIDTTGDDYTFALPPQDAGAYVDYWIEAVDSSTQNNAAVSQLFNYVHGNYIKYENGVVNFIANYGSSSTFTGSAMRMTLDGMTTVTTAFIGNYTDANNPNDSIEIHIWDDNNGNPGNDLITPITVFPAATLQQPYLITRVDLRPYSADLDSLQGDIYVGFTVPQGGAWVTQTTPGSTGRVRNFNGSTWSNETDDYHFRIVTDTMILPPEAIFSEDNTADPTIAFTDESLNNPQTWHWTFGDGDTSILQHPTHTYSSPGFKNVCLTVTNAAGSDQTCENILIQNAVPNAFFSYSQLNDPEIAFTDLSAYNPTEWYWEFGDGDTAHVQHPIHNYLDTGDYEVCLVASNAHGSDTACEVLHIYNRAPLAFFTYDIFLDTVVSFTDLSGFDPDQWHWDFDYNGDTSDLQDPDYTYPKTGGTFNVCLIAENDYGASLPYCEEIDIANLTIGLDELDLNGITVSPNPTADRLTILFPEGMGEIDLKLYGMDGSLLQETNGIQSTQHNMELGNLPNGMYLLKLTAQGKALTRIPIIVKH